MSFFTTLKVRHIEILFSLIFFLFSSFLLFLRKFMRRNGCCTHTHTHSHSFTHRPFITAWISLPVASAL